MKINSFAEIEDGQQVPPQSAIIDTLTMIQYCGASDDYARVHWDHPYMIETGFPNVVTQGWLTFARMCKAATDWVPVELADITTYAVRYHKPSFPGKMTYGGEVLRKYVEDEKRLVDLKLWAKDAEGLTTTSATMTLLVYSQ